MRAMSTVRLSQRTLQLQLAATRSARSARSLHNATTRIHYALTRTTRHTSVVSYPTRGVSDIANRTHAITSLLESAAAGDVKQLESVIATGIVTVNDCDYDRRRPLHLAAADGRVNVLEWLIKAKADINAEDRRGNTALDEAISARQDDAIRILRAAGGAVGKAHMLVMGNVLCDAAREGNVQHLQRLLDIGIDVNRSDHNNTTPLHVAAEEGHLSTVEFLLKHGAKVNNVNRDGNTPLSVAMRSRANSSKRKEIVALLKQHGALLESTDWEIKNDPLLQGSVIRSLPFIATRTKAVHVEAFLPNNEETEFSLFDQSTYTSKDHINPLHAFLTSPGDSSYLNSSTNILGKSWEKKQIIVFNDITERDHPNRWKSAKESGIRSGMVIPVLYNDKAYALIKVYTLENIRLHNDEDQQALLRFTAGIISAGVFKRGKSPIFSAKDSLNAIQMSQVYELIVNEEVFNHNLVYHEVDWFYSMGLQKYYFERFSPSEIANHIHAFIAAKKVAATTGRSEEIQLNIESKAVDGSPSWLYMCPLDHDKQVEVEKRVQAQILRLSVSQHKSYTLEFFMSQRPIIPGGKKQMALYVLENSEWKDPSKHIATESDLEAIASVAFLRTKTDAIRHRYQTIINETVKKLSPVATVFETYRDGTLPIMFSFYQAAGTTTSYMLQLTELLKGNSLIANRKFIETFANGVIVYSLYLQPSPKASIDALLKQFSMLHLVPESTLTGRFLNGEYSAEQYTYNSAASRFVYYFLNRRSEEFDVLAKSLKNDPLNFGRLRLLQTRLKREAVSQERIYACLINHPNVVLELFKDFFKIATTLDGSKLKGSIPTLNSDILAKIKNEATTILDQQILTGLLSFNAHLLRTNFYNRMKASLSFRLDPRFLADGDWPVLPYGVFYVMGSDFQGFHIRFKDIARGGIRIIRSSDRQAYNSNLETLFNENYGLAFTQNKKNKDIPEFGSKGTILLNLTNQTTPLLAFQKYTSGLLDLLIKSDDIVDNYGKEEILFLGPDEGTADYMDWAARYAHKRGYPYWRSFTTGKPPALGGIPHDRFGMTTRSVHRYVLGCLQKLGLQEENVTKFQTRRSCGHIASNEILLSRDRTKAVVDGSGVIYDPNGLDREELRKLAKERSMINKFDTAKLGAGGFRVLIGETKVTLPSGEVIDSGLAFRNEFHLHPLSSADMFVPCGGRPESVNLTNVQRLFDAKGKPRFKVIVEGANLFFTQDARMILEQAGVVLYKDASANKGGVTSSSLEVLAALAMSNEQFEEHMSVKDNQETPAFYNSYVEEIQRRIEADADLEFNCIWNEHEKSGTHRYLLTDHVSDKINTLNDFIQASSLWNNHTLRMTVLHHAIPHTLQDLVGLDAILKRVPESYSRAIFGAYLASRYVYANGLDANEMAFFEFMQPFIMEQIPASTPSAPKSSPMQRLLGQAKTSVTSIISPQPADQPAAALQPIDAPATAVASKRSKKQSSLDIK